MMMGGRSIISQQAAVSLLQIQHQIVLFLFFLPNRRQSHQPTHHLPRYNTFPLTSSRGGKLILAAGSTKSEEFGIGMGGGCAYERLRKRRMGMMFSSQLFSHFGKEINWQFSGLHEVQAEDLFRFFLKHNYIPSSTFPQVLEITPKIDKKGICSIYAGGVNWSIMVVIPQLFYYFLFPMQTVDKLFTNSTNRLPILPQPRFKRALLLPALPLQHHAACELQTLMNTHSLLQSQVSAAREELKMMEELFESICKVERGEGKMERRLQRRCKKDIIDRHPCPHEHCKRSYSSQASLQRHVKIKHRSGRMEPPQLYNDLPPEPNLTPLTDSESDTDRPEKGEESNSEREFT